MIEKILELNSINPLDIYGINNKKLDFIIKFFPKLKIISRGNELKILGEEEVIEQFEKKFDLILKHFSKYQRLTTSNIERIMLEDESILEGDNDVLVHGSYGKIIKARTSNQRKMVSSSEKNDLLFAIGPAGTGKPILLLLLL